jgi:2-haloacid dehalogenase
LTDSYRDFSTIAGAALEMIAKSRGVALSSEDRKDVLEGMSSLPAHPDVQDGLRRLSQGKYPESDIT